MPTADGLPKSEPERYFRRQQIHRYNSTYGLYDHNGESDSWGKWWVQVRHGGKSSMLFADGHAVLMSPEKLNADYNFKNRIHLY